MSRPPQCSRRRARLGPGFGRRATVFTGACGRFAGVDAREPSVEVLRELAALQGVTPTEADLEAVLGFLRVLLPKLAELERLVPAEIEP